ncbi:chemosensory receptor A [Elysia marginata]|uniref:Chemosensory receptor A n=1 Tax=Elysia marginata TaxID=1093978 RepID=A0AAV4IDA6_9GAST|nr:chemosensory receptor A [Elysia marginata]
MDISTINESLTFRVTEAYTPAPRSYVSEFLSTITVLSYMRPVIILFGLLSNVINITVFLKAGALDNVTILLIALACSDLIFLAFISTHMSGFLIFALVKLNPWPFDPRILIFLLYWPANTAYDVSCFHAVSLGVIRCACVAMPLKFKLVFTKSRTIKWSMFLVVLAVLLRIPVLTVFRVAWRTDPATNVSSLYLTSVNRGSMERVNDFLNRGIVMYLAYITMITSVTILSFKLYQASKIRQSCVKGPQTLGQVSDKPAAQGLSARDLQVVKSVVLVCSIFILAQLPFILSATVRLINPEFDENKMYADLSYIFMQVSLTFYQLNASINIFVYYNYNTKFDQRMCAAHSRGHSNQFGHRRRAKLQYVLKGLTSWDILTTVPLAARLKNLDDSLD